MHDPNIDPESKPTEKVGSGSKQIISAPQHWVWKYSSNSVTWCPGYYGGRITGIMVDVVYDTKRFANREVYNYSLVVVKFFISIFIL